MAYTTFAMIAARHWDKRRARGSARSDRALTAARGAVRTEERFECPSCAERYLFDSPCPRCDVGLVAAA